jgi:hypothetical protein
MNLMQHAAQITEYKRLVSGAVPLEVLSLGVLLSPDTLRPTGWSGGR